MPGPVFARSGAFSRDVLAEGRRYLGDNGFGSYATPGHLARGAAAVLGLGLAYAGLLTSGGGLIALAWAAAIGLAGFAILATLCHDAAHGALLPSRSFNRWVLAFGFGVFGVSGALWGWRHVHLHHVYSNVAGTDIDGEGSALVRLGAHRPWRWWYRFQPVYAPLLYTLVVMQLAWQEDLRYRRMAIDHGASTFASRRATFEFVAVKLAHLSVFLVIPALVLQPPPWGLLLGYWIATGIASLLFILLAAGTHLSTEAEFVVPEHGRIDHDWATHQLLTAVDWAPENALAVAVSGGANAHAAHHLFPQAAHSHNAELSRIVDHCAAKAGVAHHVTSFAGMVKAHLRHLAEMGRPPGDPAAA